MTVPMFLLGDVREGWDAGGRGRGEPRDAVPTSGGRAPGGNSRDADDLALMAQLRKGDRTAHNRLLQRYGAALIRYAARTVESLDRAEDVVQDVFLHLWRDRETVQVTRDVAPYLFWLTRRRALDRRAADQSATVRDAAWTSAHTVDTTTAATVDEGVERDEQQTQLARAIDTLPERCREVFTLVWREGQSYEAVAKILGVAQSTVRNQMANAIQRLFTALNDRSEK